MAQGSIVWRCRACGNKASGSCQHPRAGYSIIYCVGKRQKWETVGRNKKEAERRLVHIVAQLHQGTYRELSPIIFREFADRWLTDYVAAAVKPLTLRSYREITRKHLVPCFGDYLLTDITPASIQRFIARTLREKHLSPKTANYFLMLLKSMFKHARRWGLLRENPAQDITNARVEPKEMDFLNPAEIRALLEAADQPFKTLFLTAVMTGLRRGELIGLQWGDIDWRSNNISVRRSLFWLRGQELQDQREAMAPTARRWQFSTPKSKRSIRTVVMSPSLQDALELHRLTAPVSPHDLVFCTKDGGPLDPHNMCQREFFPALTRAGLRRIRFHDLRHTYTALLIAQGEHAKFIQNQLGHASIQTTLDRYGHLLPDAHRDSGAKLDIQIFGTTPPQRSPMEPVLLCAPAA